MCKSIHLSSPNCARAHARPPIQRRSPTRVSSRVRRKRPTVRRSSRRRSTRLLDDAKIGFRRLPPGREQLLGFVVGDRAGDYNVVFLPGPTTNTERTVWFVAAVRPFVPARCADAERAGTASRGAVALSGAWDLRVDEAGLGVSGGQGRFRVGDVERLSWLRAPNSAVAASSFA